MMTGPPEPIKLPGTERTDAEVIAELRRELELRNGLLRARRERVEKAEREREEMFLVVAAIVVKYGEDSGQGDRRVRLSDAELTDARRDSLTMYREDASGEFVLRVRP